MFCLFGTGTPATTPTGFGLHRGPREQGNNSKRSGHIQSNSRLQSQPRTAFPDLAGKKKMDTQTSFGSSNSDQQEAEQPELPKPTSLKKVIKQTNKTSHSNNSQPQKTVARQQGSTHSQGRGRPYGPAAAKTSKTNCSSSEPSAPSARRPRAAPRQASHGSPSLPSTTPGTARPVFKNLVANTAYVELDLGEDGEDVD